MDNNLPENWVANMAPPSTPGMANIITTSGVDVTRTSGIHLFPNPAGSTINLNISVVDEAEIYMTIFSLTGRKMAEKRVTIPGNMQSKISWDHGILNSGAYIIRIVKIEWDGRQEQSRLLLLTGSER